MQSVDELLNAAKQSEQDRRKLSSLIDQIADTEQQRDRLQTQCDELYRNLKDSLEKVGLSCSPGNLKFQIDLLRSNLRRYREIDGHYRSCSEKVESFKLKEEELKKSHEAKLSQMQSLLSQGKVSSPEAFREKCEKAQKLVELLEKDASRDREFQRLSGNRTLQDWKDQVQNLMELQKKEAQAGSNEEENAEAKALLLPYLPSVTEAEQEEKRIASLLAKTREDHVCAVERVSNAFQNYRSASEIEEDLAIAEHDLKELEINRRALEIAADTIETISRQQQEVLAPQLNAAVEQRFLRLCGNRYEEVKIDPDFQIWLRRATPANYA